MYEYAGMRRHGVNLLPGDGGSDKEPAHPGRTEGTASPSLSPTDRFAMAPKRTRRWFTAEFKAQAVKRVLDGGKGLTGRRFPLRGNAEVATELDVSTGKSEVTLRRPASKAGFPYASHVGDSRIVGETRHCQSVPIRDDTLQ